MNNQTYLYSGMFTTALRWVAGWTYFSAFWRRLILENKLNPDEAGYIGEKFNHFLPHALGIKPIIENLVSNPESLWWAMVSFTIIEGIGTNTYLPSRYRNGFVKSLMSKLLLLKEIWKSKYALNGQMGF